MSADKLLTQAAKLPPAELSNLILRLQALDALNSSPGYAPAAHEHHVTEIRVVALYDAVGAQLHSQLHLRPIPATKFLGLSGIGITVKNSLTEAVSQLDTLAPEMKRTEWASVLDLVAGLAVNAVRKSQAKVPWLGVANVLQNLPSLLDEHFPGYSSSGLLRLVLKLRLQKRGKPL